MRQFRFFWMIFPALLLLSLATLAFSTWSNVGRVRELAVRETQNQLRLNMHQLEGALRLDADSLPGSFTKVVAHLAMPTHLRFTVVDTAGLVLADSEEDPRQMSNHADRPEIIQARSSGEGSSVRYSMTVERQMLYYARATTHGGKDVILRCAQPLADIEITSGEVVRRTLLLALLSGLLATVVAALVGYLFARPLEGLREGAESFARGNLHQKLGPFRTAEVHSLAESMNEMAEQLRTHIQRVSRQRQETEAIFASMHEAVFAIDREGVVLKCNTAGSTLLDLPEGEQVVGKELGQLVRSTAFNGLFDQLAQQDEVHGEFELTRRNPSRFIHFGGCPLRGDDGAARGYVVVLDDITRLHRMKEMQKDFVANVSHELRTPITSIRGFVETLEAGAKEVPEQRDRFLGIIGRQTERLGAIIEDLLALSRLEKEETVSNLEKASTAASTLVGGALRTCSFALEQKQMRVVTTVPEELTVPVNANLVEQALVNLISNAAKYSPEGTEIRVEACELPSGEVRFSVRDQGPGIAPRHQERIFERFYRIDKARSREMGGTGLGLAIVKHIARVHGGSVGVQSEPGSGSTFLLTLPRT
jgi:two-component system phosphate regulon sensor histidine kinase PhoR